MRPITAIVALSLIFHTGGSLKIFVTKQMVDVCYLFTSTILAAQALIELIIYLANTLYIICQS